MTDRQQLRSSLRAKRDSLSEQEKWRKAVAATAAICKQRIFRRANNIGLYIAVGAECPTLPICVEAENAGKQLYYPVLGLRRKRHMNFVRASGQSAWSTGSFNIPEPVPSSPEDIIPARLLDLVFLPLVGFDSLGNRIGMGAGYYDRCFEFRRHRQHWQRPLLVGLAFDCQQADRIPTQPWDVPLDGIVTESGFKLF